jgi:hypothetical protein
LHSYEVEHVPFDPLVTSKNHEWFDHANSGVDVAARPVSAKIDAMTGDETLVPPYTAQPLPPYVW